MLGHEVFKAFPAALNHGNRKVRGFFTDTARNKIAYLGVVVDNQGLPRGTRVLGPVAREVKEAGFTKIASLAREVV